MNSERALLVVDVQRGFINDHTRHIPAAVERLQADYGLVIATRFVNPPGSPYREFLGWERFGAGSPDVHLAFRPVDRAWVFDKSVYSAVGARLVDALRKRGVDEVAVCGIDTEACVLATAVGLFERGFRPFVLADACGSCEGVANHRNALSLLRRLIGDGQVV